MMHLDAVGTAARDAFEVISFERCFSLKLPFPYVWSCLAAAPEMTLVSASHFRKPDFSTPYGTTDPVRRKLFREFNVAYNTSSYLVMRITPSIGEIAFRRAKRWRGLSHPRGIRVKRAAAVLAREILAGRLAT